MELSLVLLAVAVAAGLFMAWGIGANDVANAMGTSVGAGALTLRQAVLVAAVFEFAGAWLAGGEVTQTIRKGMIDVELFSDDPALLAYGMIAALMAAGCWLFIASRQGWPVSTTHSIVGAIVGFAVFAFGLEAVYWPQVGSIAASWVVSPALSGTLAFLMGFVVERWILDGDASHRRARRWIPVFMFLTGFVISLLTFAKGLKHINIELSTGACYVIAVGIGLAVAGLGNFWVAKTCRDYAHCSETQLHKMFAVMMVVTACAMAFAHGSNDVANAIGPAAAVVGVVQSGGVVAETLPVPPWLLLLGAAGIVFGLVTYGYRVIATVGRRITHLTPERGFVAELSAASVVVLASGLGLPVSTTHTLIGGILGVALVRGVSALNLRLVGVIVASWVVTLPAGGLLAVLFFVILRGVFA